MPLLMATTSAAFQYHATLDFLELLLIMVALVLPADVALFCNITSLFVYYKRSECRCCTLCGSAGRKNIYSLEKSSG